MTSLLDPYEGLDKILKCLSEHARRALFLILLQREQDSFSSLKQELERQLGRQLAGSTMINYLTDLVEARLAAKNGYQYSATSVMHEVHKSLGPVCQGLAALIRREVISEVLSQELSKAEKLLMIEELQRRLEET